jgi:hypothetical protein
MALRPRLTTGLLSRMRAIFLGGDKRGLKNKGKGLARSSLRSCGTDGVGHRCKGSVGIRAQGRDGGNAHHDDEGKHDRVFDGSRAVFTAEEVEHLVFRSREHGNSLS